MIEIVIKMIEFMFRYDFLNFLSSEFNKKLHTKKDPIAGKIEFQKKNEKTLFLAEWKLFLYWVLSEFFVTLNGF